MDAFQDFLQNVITAGADIPNVIRDEANKIESFNRRIFSDIESRTSAIKEAAAPSAKQAAARTAADNVAKALSNPVIAGASIASILLIVTLIFKK